MIDFNMKRDSSIGKSFSYTLYYAIMKMISQILSVWPME